MIGIMISVVVGVVLGIIYKNSFLMDHVDSLIGIGLCFLMLFIGMDIGGRKGVFKNIRKMKKTVVLLPFVITIGSLLGGVIAAIVLSLEVGKGLAISSGMGWYSYSAVFLSSKDIELGSIAFLSNVFRELLAIFFIPLIVKYLGPLESIAATGAPAMDSVLPIINRNNTPEIAIVSFYSGLMITIIVPILLPMIAQIFHL